MIPGALLAAFLPLIILITIITQIITTIMILLLLLIILMIITIVITQITGRQEQAEPRRAAPPGQNAGDEQTNTTRTLQ